MDNQGYIEIKSLKKQVTELKNVLQDLYGLQNGPPLIRREKEWESVMDRCLELLEGYQDENAH